MSTQNSERIGKKLFAIGLAFLLASIFPSIVLAFYANLFKFQYYRGLTAPKQQQRWRRSINLEQASEFFRTPLAFTWLISTISAAFFGLILIIVASKTADKNAKRRSDERVEQWLKDNPPKKKRNV